MSKDSVRLSACHSRQALRRAAGKAGRGTCPPAPPSGRGSPARWCCRRRQSRRRAPPVRGQSRRCSCSARQSAAMAVSLISSCRPSVQRTSTSPACRVRAVVSGETNISGPSERISTWRESDVGHLAGGDQAHLALLVDPGVVLRDLLGLPVAHQVAARVAHMGDDGLVVAQGAGHQRGGHLLAAILGRQGAVVNRGVGVLDQARQQAHRAWCRPGPWQTPQSQPRWPWPRQPRPGPCRPRRRQRQTGSRGSGPAGARRE